jgi:CRISPR system Cascade subunit CasB
MPEIKSIFTEGDASSDLLVAWWKSLDRNRGDRANLRRAASATEVAFCPSFHGFLNQLKAQGYPLAFQGASALAAVAGLAAHVKLHIAGISFARQMAAPIKQGGSARVSGLRFRRLLVVSDRDELYLQLVRVIRLLDGKVNLVSLANAVFWWNERTKKEWAYDYYATAPSEK